MKAVTKTVAPLHFIIPADGTLDPGPYQFQVINTSTVEEYGVVAANWQVEVSFNEGEPLFFSGYIEEGNTDVFPPVWGDSELNLFLSPIYVVNYE